MRKNIVIMAGGTGGHVFPGLAVAKLLAAAGYDIHWLGTAAGIESRLVPEAGYQLHVLPVSGIRGLGFKTLLGAPLMILRSLIRAYKVLRELRPIAVLGFGGFAAGPGAIAAKFLGSPLLLHEQNAVLGTTNAILQHLANRRLEGFPDTFSKRKATFYTGNPVRQEFQHSAEDASQSCAQERGPNCRILIVGGSRGARALNQQLPELLHRIASDKHYTLHIIHQCGSQDRLETEGRYTAMGMEGLGIKVEVVEFIDDMAAAYKASDLLICRAGAMTVAEISNVGVAAILVPFPFAIDDHQTENARWLQNHDAGVLLMQSALGEAEAIGLVEKLIGDSERRRQMAANAKALGIPDSAQNVAQHCLQAAGTEVQL